MNESYNVLMNLNTNVGKVRKYDNDHELQNKRQNIFNIVKSHKALNRDKKLYRGVINSPHYNYDGFEGSYTQNQALNKISTLQSVVNDGYVYMLDTETMGQPKAFNSVVKNSADELNNSIFSITEFSIVKQRYKNGKPIGEKINVLNFNSSHDRVELTKYKTTAKKTRAVANNTTAQTLRRIAGYWDENNYDKVTKKITGWDSKADFTDDDILGRGISLLDDKTEFKVGTDEYNKEVKRIFGIFNEIMEDKNAVITSMNGVNFDNPVIVEFFKNAGANVGDTFQERLNEKTVDVQQLVRGTLKNDVYEIQQKLRASGVEVDDSFSVENLIHVARELGVDIKNTDAHVALNDVENSLDILEALMPKFGEAKNRIEGSMEKVPYSTQAIYHANGAVQADDGDIFFSDSGYGNPNTYNNTLMEAGHSYKLNSYKIDKNNVPDAILEQLGDTDIEGKRILEMKDMYEGYNRSSYLLIDNQSDIQEKILNSGNVVVPKNTDETLKYVNKSTELALSDKARQTRDNFYRVNSDKGYNSFTSYLDMFKEYKDKAVDPSKEGLEKALKSGSFMGFNNEEVRINEALTKLFNGGVDGSLIHERAFNLVNMYDDFDANKRLYNIMQKAVEDAVENDVGDFAFKNNLTKGNYNTKRLFDRTKTSALATIKENITNRAMDMLSEDEVLGHIVRNNENLSSIVSGLISDATLKNGKPISPKELSKIKRRAYKDFFNEDFDKNSKRSKSYILGSVKPNGSFKDFNGIDILNPDGEYSRLQINDRSNFSKSFSNMLYGKVKSENGIKQASDNLRKNYLSSVANDLHSRGLIDNSVLENVTSSNTVQGMMDTLTNGVYNTNRRFNKLVKVDKPINFKRLSQEDTDFVKTYMNGSKIEDIITEGDSFSIMGKPMEQFLREKGAWFTDSATGGYSKEYDNIVNVAKSNIPEFVTHSLSSTSYDENKNIMRNILKENFGWNDRNIDNFFDNVINNDNLKTFQYKTSGKEVSGLSHSIVTREGQGYLISTPFDKEKIIADKIARGANLDDIGNMATVWKIPTVEEVAGVKILRQGDVAMKAITQDLVLRSDKLASGEMGQVLKVEDTLDTVINALGSKYGIVRAKELMEQGSYKSATKRLSSSWRKINSNKSLSSIGTRYKGENNIFKEIVLNRADYALKDMVNISDLVYGLDTVLKNSDLRKSYFESVGDSAGERILNEIKEFKAGSRKRKKKGFDQWDTTFKVWFSTNISDVAKEVLSNGSFAEVKPEAYNIIKKLQDVGTNAFFGKESGDANSGYVFLKSPDRYVAGASYSGVSRPLINQVMSGINIVPEDMVAQANDKYLNKVADIDDLTNKLGIKLGHGYMTDEAYNFIEAIKNEKKLVNSELGFSANVKLMSAENFVGTVNKYANMTDKEFASMISNPNSAFIKNLSTFGMTASEVDIEQIKTVARNIATGTNLWEDSSLVSPLYGQVMAPKGVTSFNAGSGVSKLKVGDVLKPGDIISKADNIRYDKNEGRIVHIDGDKVTMQLNSKYSNFKLGFGGSEKSEAIAPVVNSPKEAVIAHSLINEMFGASIVANPSLVKHESFNTMLSAYFNAIGQGINDNNIGFINEGLNKYLPNTNLKYVKDSNGRYTISEGNKSGQVSMKNFTDFFDYIKGTTDSNFKNMRDNIELYEKHSIANFDIVAMQDNTIEGYQGGENLGQGSAISKRSQSVMGSFIGDKNIDDLSRHRSVRNGAMSNLWQPLIDADIEELASDKKFVRAQEQVQNIKVALASSIGEPIENANIVKFDLGAGAVGSTIMEAENMPEIFKYSDKNRVHAYEIDLSDLNLGIRNFIYDDLEEKGFLNTLKNSNLEEKVSKIYIPALDANYMNNEYILTETQKKASDFINSVNEFRNGNFTTSIDEAKENITESYKELMKAYRYDLVAGDGLNERSQKIKSLYSSRMKMSKVAAPVINADGTYMDEDFRKASNKIINGKEKYYGAVFVSETDFTNKGLKMSTVGEQLVKENLDNSDEALSILKNSFKNNIELQKAKDMETARKILKGTEIGEDTFSAIGRKYLTDIGIYGEVMRDPAFKTTSYQAVKIRLGNITSNTVSVDSVTAKLMNADVDGDEINVRFRGINSKSNVDNVKLRNADDIQVQTLKNIMETNSDYNLDLYKAEIDNYKNMKATRLGIKDYMKEMKSIGRDIENLDYFKDDTKYAGLLARFLKASIGQISNPNYYLRAASNSYFARNPFATESYKGLSAINALTDIAEQKLIDTKSVKTLSTAMKTATLASSYRESMDEIASLKADKKKQALHKMYKSLLTVTDLDNEGSLILGYDKKLLDNNLEQSVEDAVQRILKGNINRANSGIQHTLEESLYYVNQVLSDTQSRDVFFSSYIRQTDIKYKAGESINELEAIKRAIDPEANPYDELAKLTKSYNYLDSSVFLNGSPLNVGDRIYSTERNGNVREGVYSVTSSRRIGTKSNLELKNEFTGESTTILDKSFRDITNKISGMNIYNDGMNFESELTNKYIGEISSGLKGYSKVKSTLATTDKDNFYNKVATSALSEFNTANLEDTLGTAEVLKSKGFISESDASLFIKQMNDSVREKGTKNYRENKLNKLLGLSSLQENSKINALGPLKSFLENEVTQAEITSAISSARYKSITETMQGLNRINLDNIKIINDKAIDQVVKELALKDLEIIENLKSIISENSDDISFVKDVLGLKLEDIDDLLKNNKTSEAIDVINSSKIAYGQFIGFDIGELTDDMLDAISTKDYDTSGVSEEVVNRTSKIINKVKNLKSEGVARTITPPKSDVNEMVTEMIKTMNDNTKKKGSVGNSDKLNGKSIIDKINDVTNKAKGNKKVIMGATAMAGAVLAGSYIYGHSKLNKEDKKYVKNNTSDHNGKVKQTEVGATANTGYKKVPSSDMGYYGSGEGVEMNISGKSPSNSDPSELNKTMSRIFGGAGVSVNTSVSDSRRSIEDNEIEQLLTSAIM